ncbi:hypothetical protein [Acetobacter conturbans]|uniref:Uncharacterized protein n=1 Tax=Acetobacter conturbans TaxID=1737472 RepID=A0ABX0JY97_9PROT|nr:hypothetical protein [Acetobacter conturbans]NHN88286.1 hypothetical protein [Acetobacter conturbans]
MTSQGTRERVNEAENIPAILVTPMVRADVPIVFPLVAMGEPGLTLARWTRRARRLTIPETHQKNGAILARYSGRPGPCGIAFYRVEAPQSGAWRVLCVYRVVVITMGSSGPVTLALIHELSGLAAELGCTATRIHLSRPDPATIFGLCSSGYAGEAILLHKNITPAEVTPT